MATDPATQAGQSAGQAGALGAGSTAPATTETTGTPANGTWFESLPEGLRGDPSLQAFKGKDVSAVVESYINAQKLVGGSLRVPGKDAKPEDVQRFKDEAYTKLGRPETPDKYSYKRPAPEELGIQWSEAEEKQFLQAAHKLGLNSEQVEGLMRYQAELTKRSGPDYAADYENCMKTLTDGEEGQPGWGSMTPRFLGVAKRAVDSMFPAGTMAKLDASGLSNDPAFIRGLYRVGKELIEDGVISGDVEPRSDGQDSMQVELDRIMKDPKNPYFDATHADHEAAVRKVLDIRRFMTA
jgi:hypothetical protein